MQNQFRANANLILAFLAAVVAIAAVWLFFQKEPQPNIKIGVLHSLTGTMAISEAPLVDALRLAVEEANQEGGIDGAQIEMVVADCRSNADYCAQQAEKLISENHVQALFGCWTSACRKAVNAEIGHHHQLLFYPLQYEGMEHATDTVYTGAVPNQQLVPMVAWAMQQRRKRVYLIGSDYVFPHTANRIVKEFLKTQEGRLLAERYVPLSEQQMDEVASEIAKLHPDFVVNTLNGDSNRYFFQALKKARISAADIPVFSTSIAEAELAAIGPELVAGHYAAWNYFMSIDSDENRAFIERFRKRFGAQRVLDDPMESTYIGVKMWVNALRDADRHDAGSLSSNLAQQTLLAPEGIVSFEPDTMHLWKTARIGKARADGQFDIVWQSARAIKPAPFPFFISHEQIAAMAEGTR